MSKKNTQPHPTTHTHLSPQTFTQALPPLPPELHTNDAQMLPRISPHPPTLLSLYMPVFPSCVPSANNFVNS